MRYMYSFITKTHNPIGGGFVEKCDGTIEGCYGCIHCWATALKDRHRWEKYFGAYRLIDKLLIKRFKPEDFVFAFDMIEIGHPDLKKDVFHGGMLWVGMQPCPVLILSKNPAVFHENHKMIPSNAYLGATVETDTLETTEISSAPTTLSRLAHMEIVKMVLPENKQFFSIEPILKFSSEFANRIISAKPWAVAVGYDNHKHKLNEPSLADTEKLIAVLEENDIKVYRKTIRKAWWEEVNE